LMFENVSRWYGQIIGLNDVSVAIRGGVTGLLGLNGAGKSTFLKMAVGRLKPNKGTIRLFGIDPWTNPAPYARVGYCPESEKMHDWMTAHSFVSTFARLYGYTREEAGERATDMLDFVGLREAMDREIGGFSKGMRQRVKLAHSLVNDPELLILDEPLQGCDPLARTIIMDLVRKLGAEGRTIIVTSHILQEVERITEQIIILHNGRLLALGNIHAIRELLDKHPHRICLSTPEPRKLATGFLDRNDVVGLEFEDDSLMLRTRDLNSVHSDLPKICSESGVRITGIDNPDDNLESIIEYLMEGRR